MADDDGPDNVPSAISWRFIIENRSTMFPTMYDAVNPDNIPRTPPPTIVAGYINGPISTWPAPAWTQFPTAYMVRISVLASADAGEVLDVESGDATPEQAPNWVRLRRAAGIDPVIYCNQGTWEEVQAAFAAASMPQPHYWIANWDNQPTLISGAIAHQYKNDLSPGYDVSVVDPMFRWAMPTPSPAPTPTPPPIPSGGFNVSNMPTISQGSTGNVVKTAQSVMAGKMGQHIAIDGVFGPATKLATENIQRFFALKADGIIGPQTWGALLLL